MIQNAHILSANVVLGWDSTGWPSWVWGLEANHKSWNTISAHVPIRNMAKREIIGAPMDYCFTSKGSQACTFQSHSQCCTNLKAPTLSYLCCAGQFLQPQPHLSPFNCRGFVDWNVWTLTAGVFSLTKNLKPWVKSWALCEWLNLH